MPRGSTSVRPPKGPYENRKAYIRANSTSPVPKICNVMAGDARPWLTLVIGSGCATTKSQEIDLFRMADGLRDRKSMGDQLPTEIEGDRLPTEIENEAIGDVVASFATGLIRDRLRLDHATGVSDGRTGDSSAAEKVPDWLFRFFAAAAFNTRLYYRIKSFTSDAPRRPDRDDNAVLVNGSRWGLDLDEDFVTPCEKVLRRLKNDVDEIVKALAKKADNGCERPEIEPDFKATVKGILGRMNPRKAGGSVQVSLADLQAITEFAWFCFTKVVTPMVYPGWSDLLLDLSTYDSPSAGSIGTPLVPTMVHAQRLIKSRYTEVTKQSWRTIWKSDGPQEDRHYDAAAQLLNAQHHYRTQIHEDFHLPPPTTAFVTSFDLELELSLLKVGKPFTVVLPVHVMNTTQNVAHTCWVSLSVPAKDNENTVTEEVRLDCLMKPPSSSWSVLDEEAGTTGPVVVRLAGCPLIDLPRDLRAGKNDFPLFDGLMGFVRRFLKMDARGDGKLEAEIMEKLQLQHAVVINEHDAILQSAIDLIPIPDGYSVFGYEDTGRHRGLPAEFAAGERKWSRFWMLLGVQIHDSAVRHRTTTLISSLPIPLEVGRHAPPTGATEETDATQTAPAGSDKTPEVVQNGVAVNKHLTALEKDLLFWNGFDIVTDDASEFTTDLKHYAAHLTPEEDDKFGKGWECRLKP